MRDPFAHQANEARDNRLARDPQVTGMVSRLVWLRIASGLVALALIAAMWLTWRWG